MKTAIWSSIAVCLQPCHLRQTLLITLIVGTWLTLYNQGNVVLASEFSIALLGKIFLNYFTPFLVSNWGLISREPDSNH